MIGCFNPTYTYESEDYAASCGKMFGYVFGIIWIPVFICMVIFIALKYQDRLVGLVISLFYGSEEDAYQILEKKKIGQKLYFMSLVCLGILIGCCTLVFMGKSSGDQYMNRWKKYDDMKNYYMDKGFSKNDAMIEIVKEYQTDLLNDKYGFRTRMYY